MKYIQQSLFSVSQMYVFRAWPLKIKINIRELVVQKKMDSLSPQLPTIPLHLDMRPYEVEGIRKRKQPSFIVGRMERRYRQYKSVWQIPRKQKGDHPHSPAISVSDIVLASFMLSRQEQKSSERRHPQWKKKWLHKVRLQANLYGHFLN